MRAQLDFLLRPIAISGFTRDKEEAEAALGKMGPSGS
ncbi:hypothetical protein GGE24_007505 [Bradyrhizobium centrosematis]|nr:hypothetical protein [Bradyrhizobium centrosematis]MCS3778130.1 hypothetical protein [Bradyrhizobium centrosematis]